MKTIAAYLILLVFFINGTCIGQKNVTKKELFELYGLSESGNVDGYNKKIDSIKNYVTEKDSLYEYAIGLGAELNEKAAYLPESIKYYKEEMTFFKLFNSLNISTFEYINLFEKIANLEMYMGDFENSIADYKLYMAANKKYGITTSYNNVATVYNMAGRYQDAIDILNQNPYKNGTEFYTYSMAYYNLNQLDSAKKNIERAISDTSKIYYVYAAFKLAASIYSSLGDKQNACEYISKASQNLIESGDEERLKNLPEKARNCFYVKQMMTEITEIKKKKTELCN